MSRFIRTISRIDSHQGAADHADSMLRDAEPQHSA